MQKIWIVTYICKGALMQDSFCTQEELWAFEDKLCSRGISEWIVNETYKK